MAQASLALSASTAARLAPWPPGLATWLHWVPFQFRMSPPLPTAHTSLADTALRPCRTPLTCSETMLHVLPFQCSMTTGFPLPTAARAQTSAGEMAAMERIRPAADRAGGNSPLRAVPVLDQRRDPRVVDLHSRAARPGVGRAVGADRVQLAIRRLAGRGGDVAPGLAVPVLDEAGAGVLPDGPDVAGARPRDTVERGC